MAQPRASAKRIKTEETNFPLRPHVVEWRQKKYTMIVPIKIAASATTGLGIASFIASVPFDVGSVTMEATMMDAAEAYTATTTTTDSTISQAASVTTVTGATHDTAALTAMVQTAGNGGIDVDAGTLTITTAGAITASAYATRSTTNPDQTVAHGAATTNYSVVDSNQGALGIREWAAIFGPAQAPVPSWTTITHDFPRPVPIQGTKFTVDAWRTYNADVANGIWKDGAWAASATYGALRITFHRAD